MPESLSNEEFDYIYARVPRVCVDLVIETKNGLVLIKREDPPELGAWHMPGGGIRMHESLEDAAKRIAKRELNVDIKLGSIIGYDEYLHEPRILGDAHSLGVIFQA